MAHKAFLSAAREPGKPQTSSMWSRLKLLTRIISSVLLNPLAMRSKVLCDYFLDTRFRITRLRSNYNSLQVGVTKRFSYGLQFLASYTFSHSLDDYSGDPTGTSDVTVVPGNQAILNNYASSDFDRRHRFVLSGLYDLPKFYKGDSHFAQQAVNGWQLATILTLQSGTPFSVLTNDNAFVQARADFASGC